MDTLLEQMKLFPTMNLFKVMEHAGSLLLKKALKSNSKAGPKKASKKPVAKEGKYDQLKKPREWVTFVLRHAQQHGWEAFEIHQSKKNKETGEKTMEVVQMPASVCVDGVYYYAGSIDEETGKGKMMITKHAMSLSKLYWSNKDKKGTHPELYEEFEDSYSKSIESSSESDESMELESEVEEQKVQEVKPKEEPKKASKSKDKVAKKISKESEDEAPAKKPVKAKKEKKDD